MGIIWISSSAFAANISEFVNIHPYVEVGGGYDDNIFQIPDDRDPEDNADREDSYFDAIAGVKVDLMYERQLLDVNLGMDYAFTYKKYSVNTDLDDSDHKLDFDLSVGSKYQEGFFRDRAKLNVSNVLTYIPIDQEASLLPGNRTWRNNFEAGIGYNLISKPRTAFIVDYTYDRIDYGDDPITVWTTSDYDRTSMLTEDSQSHRGSANFKHALNSKLTYVLTYAYQLTLRDENELVSSNFSRHHVITGVETKLTSRMTANLKGGYSMTSYEDVGHLSQDDQESFIAEASLTGNFGKRPLMTVGYKRYFVENDFGDTLLTDDFFGRFGFKIAQGLMLNLRGDYLDEARDLYGDDTKQLLLSADTEYELVKNLKMLLAYNYRKRDFFTYDFLEAADREETSHIFSGGLEYKITQYVLLKGMYYHTEKTSNLGDNDYARNQFVASGRVIF
ncbi:hypothetical protein CSB45_03990 [candidate division KSB3 bacterium]|uniref:TIGR03016 family PEP-CTERM system-associated outer membrane protein n=1 Tax=candidate division KSB3 bacterium TaxID=2044937 RepID=A0A2G6E8G4_9BACT|nr:MAG: hypothetical protein CSB45_03990 [candidate division KSB3 bacterium]PIE30541.1 MAG: hypothetical protein CSA57_02575 [candidate division KSB3 bacterium]